MPQKKLGSPDIIGQQGVNLVEKACLDMGLLWRPTPLFDTGIDGTIEIRDPITEEVTNSLIHVQVKSTTRRFTAETEAKFEYVCSEKDLQYWLQGNAPVLLVIVRPDTDEAYWVSIKHFFDSASKIQSRRILFDKKNDRFAKECRQALVDIAIPQDRGIYFTPPLKKENLYSNLIPIQYLAPRLYLAETEFRKGRDLWAKISELSEDTSGEWILRNKRILSFHDLTKFPWNQICDQGTVEYFDTEEWSLADDIDRQRDFVQLLNLCLRQKTRAFGLRYLTLAKNSQSLFNNRISFIKPE